MKFHWKLNFKCFFVSYFFGTTAGEEITYSYISHRSIQNPYNMLSIHTNLQLNWQIYCPEGNF